MQDLLEELVPRVYRFALRLTGDATAAEDLAQEAFLRAWRQRGRLRDAASARVWLFQIAVNLWRDNLRRDRSPVARAAVLEDVQVARDCSPADAAEQRDELRRVTAALDCLPPRQREVLYLHACEGLSIPEIIDVLQASEGTVKTSLCLARRRMRELWGDSVSALAAPGGRKSTKP